jgi:hypothetical protein
MTPRPPLSFLRISISLFTRTPMCCLFEAIYLVDYLFGGLSAWRAVFFCVCDFFPVSVDGSTFSSLPDGLRHFYGDHNPYSILRIPYSMLYVIYDLEGSNDVNLQSTEFDPCR